MKAAPTLCQDLAPRADALAIHLLQALTTHHAEGRRVHTADLAHEIGARHAEVRAALTRMHHAGWIDVLRMRPTLLGFALGRSLAGRQLRPLRRDARRGACAA